MSLKILLIVIIVIVAILGWKGLSLRKEISCQEVVPLEGGIAILNGDPSLIDKLQTTLHDDSGKPIDPTNQSRGVFVFQKLLNGKSYRIEIRRTDLKGRVLYKPLRLDVSPRKNGSKYFVLVGASVGKAWEFEKIPNRLSWKNDIVLGYRAKYDFDKSSEIHSLVALQVPVSGVIIKECAAYFPRDIKQSKKIIKEWIALLTSHQITPILATVVPVTREHETKHSGRLISILEFNDFIREFAFQKGILVLDLERALRISDDDRHLKNEFAHPDGLHLVKRAYEEALDKIVLPIIDSAI